MKKFLLILALSGGLQAADYDFRKGIDLTALSAITAAQLNQLVDNGLIATNKGLIIITNGTPAVANRAQYTNFVWLDKSSDPPVLKVYQSSSATWVSATIGAGSIGANNLAVNAVTQTKVATDAITSTNIIDGSIANIDLALASVTSSTIADGSVINAKLADGSVTDAKIGVGAVVNASIGNGVISFNKLSTIGVSGISNIISQSIISNNIAYNTIMSTNIALNTIHSTNIVLNTILSTNIGLGTIARTNMSADSASGMIKAWIKVNPDGTRVAGYNLNSARTGEGVYTLTYSNSWTDTNYCMTITPHMGGASQPFVIGVISTNTVPTTTTTTVSILNSSTGVARDSAFNIMVIGN